MKKTWMNLKSIGIVSIASAGMLASVPAFAQSTPHLPETIRIVVPFTPGGSNDVFARSIAEQLSKKINRSVIVENKPGAGGSIGSNDVARAKPDGGTLLLSSSSFVTRAAVDSKLPYDARTSFEPVAMVARGPMLLVTSTEVPYKTVPELIEAAKKGVVNYASSGIGSVGQLSAELLSYMADIPLTHIPYKGMSGAVTDLMGGRIDIIITTPASLGGAMESGRIRQMAATTLETSSFFPDLPTVAQTVPDYSVEIFWGIYAPANTPKEIVDYFNKEIVEITHTDHMKKVFANEASEASAMTADEYKSFVDAEITKWSKVAEVKSISLD
ncbi:Bug family tripartite tricarboxylate transporter substrate binding protein [Orrella sp. 11846]|uniref:Bug family tripartite tricarboxylate transporter substrate binding protein n=1 Tax=Orrella sp. 11846 TaxID=3409913 RepID=UPI003B5CFD18